MIIQAELKFQPDGDFEVFQPWMARSAGGLDKQRFARRQETFHINFHSKSEEREI